MSDTNRTIIIGSGTSVLEYTWGRYIDSFNNVIRFNGFQDGLGSTDEFTGTKLDTLMCNTTSTSYSRIVSTPVPPCHYTVATLNSTKRNISNGANIIKYLSDSGASVDSFSKLGTKYLILLPGGDRFTVNRSHTLGLWTIVRCIYSGIVPVIHGFDFVDNTNLNRDPLSRQNQHYYNLSEPTTYHFHNLRQEAEFIHKLIDIGKVVELKTLVSNGKL
jgi:hypothetical protein